MQTRHARLLFHSAALFNWGATLLFLPALGLARAIGIDPAPTGTIFELIAIAAIFSFGLGYWRAASAPVQYDGIVRIGLMAKLLVVAIVYGHFVTGDANLTMAAVVSGDLIYALLFWRYLSTSHVART